MHSFQKQSTDFKLSKHDRYVQELTTRIKDNYDSITTNVSLKHEKRSLGEIDVLAKKGNTYDLYEVKCSYRPLKAKKQLQRIKKFFKEKNTRTFFYCGNSKLLVTI